MNAAAIAQLKAAVEKKKSGWKEPVVKEFKVSKEQYLQEKAEEEAKKNKKAALRAGGAAVQCDGSTEAAVSAANTAKNAVTTCQMLLRQVQSERQALQQEVLAWKKEMEEHASSSRQSQQQHPPPSAVDRNDETKALVSALASRFDALERKTAQQQQQQQTVASRGDDKQIVELVSRCGALEKRVALLEQSREKDREQTLVSPKRPARSKSRGRKATKDAAPTSAMSPVAAEKPKITSVGVHVSPKSKKKSRAESSESSVLSPTKDAVSASAATTTAPSSDVEQFCQPHSVAKVAKYQARDETLVAYLSKGATTGLYPKFSMSVKTVEGSKLVFFYKKIYIPSTLRDSVMKHYHETYPSTWTRQMAKHVIWPSLDADITTFNGGRK